jgi:hypothetical protein
MKSNEKIKRESNEGKEDKFMMMIRSKNKNKKPLQTYHLTAIIKRSIHYQNKQTGKVSVYKEEDHSRLVDGHDRLTDSRAVEASSLQEAHQLMGDTIGFEQTQEEYSSHAIIHIDSIQFIDDPIIESQITSSDVRNMPLRQSGYLEYNFTTQETKYLNHENTCVIDNLVGVYGDDLNIDRNDIIKLNKEFYGFEDVEDEPQYIQSDLGDMIINPKYNINNQLKNAEVKLKQYEEEYKLLKIDDVEVEDVIDIQDIETKLKQCEEEYKDKNEYYINVLNQFKTNYKFLNVSDKKLKKVVENYNDIIHIKITHTYAVFDEDFTKFIEIMEQYNEHVRTIQYNHDIYNCRIRELKQSIHPTPESVEMKAHDKKLKEETIKTKNDYILIILKN